MLETLYKKYGNIGEKIKRLAFWGFIVEAIAAIIGGIGLTFGYQGHPYAILGGLATIFFGPIVAWVSSWLLYGFGQLIENSDIVAKNTQAPATSPVAQQTTTPPVAQQEGDSTGSDQNDDAKDRARVLRNICFIFLAVIAVIVFCTIAARIS